MWNFSGDEDVKSNVGATALAGLSLLECDVSEDDPAVQRAARYIRRYAPTLDHTYSLTAARKKTNQGLTEKTEISRRFPGLTLCFLCRL